LRLLIIGNRGGTNVGACFERAARSAGIEVRLVEASSAITAPAWLRRFNWYFRGHRPTRLGTFATGVLRTAAEFKPQVILATGIAPLNRETLARLNSRGIQVLNFLTDDPWNPAHRAPWFLRALPQYSAVFSPRHLNLPDLLQAGCRHAVYLPFGYDPELHFPDPFEGHNQLDDALLFIGAADPGRINYCRGLVSMGLRLDLYGDFWNDCTDLRRFWHGYADLVTLRRVSNGFRISLCLVRRANRDGHTMRTFESAAMRGCLLVEDTSDHREIFGPDGEAVIYFSSVRELQTVSKYLLAHEAERRRLANAAHERITRGAHTYADRLQRILEYGLRLSPQPVRI
jgi:hypothetical protein